ncbi:uncharacterized protein LOC110113314 [Dendrobium catenatum]|uniref:uncharacterized protein LOC110113314 n=1 Tax=Dendrobium catenatum TaxID=906689 RepID=UPI0009F259AF|nr:uncharacterized protein LOC110113314 [Dendrobium catenatum]
MPLIVKETQAGFVKARISTDSILLANDILSLVNKGGAGNIFCAKLDIKKAFDTISREFLLARMHQKGFPKPFISWIKACITKVNFSIIIDGALEGFFSSSAGLRQGCPLSPYLFCIVMDVLSNLLDERGFKGFKTDNYHLSHILYADDVLILGDATIDNCKILSSVLKEFANATGLHINYEKCSIMFSKNQRNQEMLCQALSITNVSTKLTYLGIPISFTRLKVKDFMPLMDKLHKKFIGWKANLLSFAGRLQFLKFTIQNTIVYWIRGSIIPKTKGGLGIPSIAAIQHAFNCSTAASIKRKLKFVITPNAPISLCWDHWCSNITLAEYVGGVSLDCFIFPYLKNYISNNNWVFNNNIPQILKNAVSSFKILESEGSCLLWKDCAHPKFRDYIKDFYSDLPDNNWHNFVWHKKGMIKHSVYVWLALVGGLKTQDALRLRNINVLVNCSLCYSAPETINHIFFDCPYSFTILSSIIPGSMNFLLRPTILQLFHWMETEFSGSQITLNFYLLTWLLAELVNGETLMSCWRTSNLKDPSLAGDYWWAGSLTRTMMKILLNHNNSPWTVFGQPGESSLVLYYFSESWLNVYWSWFNINWCFMESKLQCNLEGFVCSKTRSEFWLLVLQMHFLSGSIKLLIVAVFG